MIYNIDSVTIIGSLYLDIQVLLMKCYGNRDNFVSFKL